MGWTKPRLLAKGNEWYGDDFDNEGPACYELGTGGPRGGKTHWHYIGETANEKKRATMIPPYFHFRSLSGREWGE
jgi:hypothetical protein